MAALVVCDAPLIGAGIEHIVEKDAHKVVNTVETIEEMERTFAEHGVDLAIVDPHNNGGAGLEMVSWICGHYPKCPVILLTGKVSDELLVEAGKIGVAEVAEKSIDRDELRVRVGRILRGEYLLSKERVLEAQNRLDRRGMLELVSLGEVDREIMRYLGRGCTDREIAERVYLSPQTVRNRVSRLLTRLGRENRTQLALMLQEHDDVYGLFT